MLDKLNMNEEYFESGHGTGKIWIEQGTSIHIKTVTETNDPVELSAEEALNIVDVLSRFAKRI